MGLTLCLHEIDQNLVLVSLVLEQEGGDTHGLIDYNIECFREEAKDVFQVGSKSSLDNT